MNINQVYFSGNLGRDAEIKVINESKVTLLYVCHSKRWQVNGEWKEKPIWVKVLVFQSLFSWNGRFHKLYFFLIIGSNFIVSILVFLEWALSPCHRCHD